MPGIKPAAGSFLLIIIAVVSALLTDSCQGLKDEEPYVGDWQSVETVTADQMVYTTTRTLHLTRNSYEETYVITRQSLETISGIIGTGGRIIRSHNHITFELQKLGTCAKDSLDACTSSVIWYHEGTQYWTDNAQFFGLVIKADYKAADSTLTLTRDLNNDGDTLDEGENVVFTRI